jgi:anaerobic selenocysteine-containing dehydrogenase
MEFASTILEEAGMDALPVYREPKYSPVSTPELASEFPLILTTGARLPMYVHSRTFRLPWTKRLHPNPTLDIHPVNAAQRGIFQGDRVTLITPRNSFEVDANLTEIVPPGTVNIYHGYTDPEINVLFEPDYLDPISGFPGFKSALCDVRKAPHSRRDEW